jgi:hypothetical protein
MKQHDIVTRVYTTWLKENNNEIIIGVPGGGAYIPDSNGQCRQLQERIIAALGKMFAESRIPLYITWLGTVKSKTV